MTELPVGSDTLDRWHKRPVPLCPAIRTEPDPCDCGYEGDWLMRHWKSMQPCEPTSAHRSSDGTKVVNRRCDDCKAGGPGHLLYAGWEEKCPRCGDEERFTFDGELVHQRRNPAYDGPRNHKQTDVWELLGMDDD